MVKVAIAGYGVIGMGVAKILDEKARFMTTRTGTPVELSAICDLRDFPDVPHPERFIKDYNLLLEDKDLQIVVECMGGVNAAFDLAQKTLRSGRHFITSNKELVAEKGDILIALARENHVNFLFEASVGGGIPILRPMAQCLSANRLLEICGILNGTTNYILTQMKNEGLSFADALAQAQQAGYAEADPAADISGKDACRKICILAALSCGAHVYPKQVSTQGIEDITLNDVCYAESQGCRIKLLARAVYDEQMGLSVIVAPHCVPENHPLFAVEDVYNAVLVKGDAVGDVMFYGRGAGQMPTASAVVADIIDTVKHFQNPKHMGWEAAHMPIEDLPVPAPPAQYYIRLAGETTGRIVDASAPDAQRSDAALCLRVLTP